MTRHDKSFLYSPIHLQPLVSGLLVFCRHEQKTLWDYNRICQQISLSLFSAILSVSLFPPQNKWAVYTDAPDSSLCLNLIRCLEIVCSPCTGVQSSLFFLFPPLLFISVSAHRLLGPDKLKSGWNMKNVCSVLQRDLIYKLCTIYRLVPLVSKSNYLIRSAPYLLWKPCYKQSVFMIKGILSSVQVKLSRQHL